MAAKTYLLKQFSTTKHERVAPTSSGSSSNHWSAQ